MSSFPLHSLSMKLSFLRCLLLAPLLRSSRMKMLGLFPMPYSTSRICICSCACITASLTTAQQDVLKPGSITLQFCPFHSRLFGLLCFRVDLRIISLSLWRLPCVCECFRWWESLTMVLSVCERGSSFCLPIYLLIELCHFHWRGLSHPELSAFLEPEWGQELYMRQSLLM